MDSERSYNAGEFLYRAGDPTDTIFLIKSGKVALVREKGQSFYPIRSLGPKSILGEEFLLTKSFRKEHAVALEKTYTILIHRNEVEEYFDTENGWRKELFETLCGRYIVLEETMDEHNLIEEVTLDKNEMGLLNQVIEKSE